MTLIRWTGHPLVDVGIAGACAFARRTDPADVTLSDLDAVADFMESTYYRADLVTYLSCVFMNASFVQSNESAEKRGAFVKQYLRAHRATPDPRVAGRRCAFSGEAATSPLVRTHLPLFSGEEVFSFRPNSETAVPAAGPYIVALMFLPMASRRAEGRLLAVHSDDPSMTMRFARRYLEDNRRLLATALPDERSLIHEQFAREQPMWDAAKKKYKFADAKGPRSLVIADLAEIARDASPSDLRPTPVALTAYLISNSGQGPSLEVFEVPSGVTNFVIKAGEASTRSAWDAVAKRFYALSAADDGKPSRRGKRQARVVGRPGWTRNPAFEDLCRIYEGGFTDRKAGAAWLRRYVLGRIEAATGTRYEAAAARNWALADLFLSEVMAMNEARIRIVRDFADKLAHWIEKQRDRRLFQAIAFGAKPYELRNALLKAQRESAKSELIFGLDEFAKVWLHEDGDEFLIRDLICIRVVERLHAVGYFATHPEDVLDNRGTSDDVAIEEGA